MHANDAKKEKTKPKTTEIKSFHSKPTILNDISQAKTSQIHGIFTFRIA